MRYSHALFAATLAFALPAPPAPALTRHDFMTLVMPMSDLEANQRLEREVSVLVETNDGAGLEALGDRIRSENGKALDEITALGQRLTATGRGESPATPAPPDDSDREVLLMFGPCQYAGLLLRNIVVGIAKGDLKPVFRQKTVMIDGNDLDALFAENMDRCEIIRKKPSSARLVGHRCLTTGQGCMDDPDFADHDDDAPK